MYIISLLFWVIAFIALKGDYKNPINRWFSATAFTSGFGGIPVVWRENILPRIHFAIDKDMQSIINFIICLISSFPYYISPYCFLMLALTYKRLIPHKWRRVVPLVLLIPTFLMYIIYPVINSFNPSFVILSLWVVPYIIFSDIVIVMSYFTETVPIIKRGKLYIAIVTVPVTLSALVTSYIMPACGIDGWIYTLEITIFQGVAFFYLLFNYGVMGAKLKLEKNNMDTAMKAIISNNAVLNHAIKNQINKILMSVENLDASIKEKDNEVKESINAITDSSTHLLEMVKRIQEKSSDIVLKQGYYSVYDIIEQSIAMVKDDLLEQNVVLTKNYNLDDVALYCDIVHVKEVIINVIKNSIEALDLSGNINISIGQNKKWIFIEISDNGKGIPKEFLSKVIQPFFSTKNNQSLNFGLGLSYVYNVMRKHGGSLDIESQEKVGTSVFLYFPQKKVLNTIKTVNEVLEEGA